MGVFPLSATFMKNWLLPVFGTSIRHSYGAVVVMVGSGEFILDVRYRRVYIACSCWVTALNHETLNNSVKDCVIICFLLNQMYEVTCSYRHIIA